MNFALITEGISEHKIIKHIVSKYFKDKDPDFTQVQPEIANNKQISTGGWVEVLKYCEKTELESILIENDYVVIQIDSDLSQTKPFDVLHTRQDNTSKSPEELHNDIIEKLKSLIKPNILKEYEDRIIFAICIHKIECWLLPLYYTNHHKSSIGSCVSVLNFELRKRDLYISETNKNSPHSVKAYDAILKNLKNKKDITNSAQHNFGYNSFINSLNQI